MLDRLDPGHVIITPSLRRRGRNRSFGIGPPKRPLLLGLEWGILGSELPTYMIGLADDFGEVKTYTPVSVERSLSPSSQCLPKSPSSPRRPPDLGPRA